MTWQIRLIDADRELLKTCLLSVIDYKYQTLTKQRFRIFEDWAASFASQLVNNEFTVNDPTKNSFTWLIDQIEHCGDFQSSDLAKVSKEICLAACKNNQEYRKLCNIRNYQDLFKEPSC